tara:strand:- start:48 stop:194 length:147 start_codon:yes stop_codon:yes gene_type:complete
MRPERLHNMLKAGVGREVQVESVTTSRNTTAAELALFFKDESERERKT